MATVALLAVGLMGTGGAYALFTNTVSTPIYAASGTTVEDGQKLFAANCATCHGASADGLSAAAVDFQLSSGRMPPEPLSEPLTQPQIDSLVAYIASLDPAGGAPAPSAPDEKYLKGDGNAAIGAELFRTNCAACHNIAGAGGALTQGDSAPEIADVSARSVYQAMLAGPGNMPVFSDTNLTPLQKADIITFLKYKQENPSPGGFDLGSLGPFSEGLFILIFGLGTIVGFTIWLSARAK